MRLVVDSNVLFTFFWKDSVLRGMLSKHELFAPEQALNELNEHAEELIRRLKLPKEGFYRLRGELAAAVSFIDLAEYEDSFPKALSMAKDFPQEQREEFMQDIDFFALAIKLSLPIWSNDKLFKRQSRVTVFDSADIIKLSGN